MVSGPKKADGAGAFKEKKQGAWQNPQKRGFRRGHPFPYKGVLRPMAQGAGSSRT